MPDPTGVESHIPRQHRGVSWKQPCRVATTATITISTALNNGDSIDGVTLATGDRVLVKDQSTGNQNGIYVAGVTPTRAFDMDQDGTTSVPAEEIAGAFVYVIAGTANAGKTFHTTNVAGGTLGSTTITWVELSAAGGITVQDEGTPLTTAATTLNFAGAGVTASSTTSTKLITIPGNPLTVQDEGTPLATDASTLNFTGAGVTASGTGATKTVNIPGASSANTIIVQDEGTPLTTDATTLNFVGGGVTATGAGATKTITVPAPTTIANDTIWAAKGDLAGATGNDAAAVLTVGSNNQVLVADSAQTTGMKWAAVSSVDPEGWTSIIKSADQDVTDAANTDDSELQFATTSGKHYMLQCLLMTSGNNTTGDFEWRFTASAGTLDGRGSSLGYTVGNTAEVIGYAHIASASGTAVPVGVQGTLGFINFVEINFAFLQNTSNATVKLQFGNNSVSVGAGRTSRIGKGSIMRWKQLD